MDGKKLFGKTHEKNQYLAAVKGGGGSPGDLGVLQFSCQGWEWLGALIMSRGSQSSSDIR